MNLTSLGRRMRGFTLIELMIAVAIVGILVAIAYPSYRGYVVRSNRADAQQALLLMAQQAERYFAIHNSYDPASGQSLEEYLAGAAPETRARGIYVFSVADVSATEYALEAAPASSKANKGDGNLTLDSTGAKVWEHPHGDKSWSDR